jgi:hypothetical protein
MTRRTGGIARRVPGIAICAMLRVLYNTGAARVPDTARPPFRRGS